MVATGRLKLAAALHKEKEFRFTFSFRDKLLNLGKE